MSLWIFLVPYVAAVIFLMCYIFFGLRMVRQQGTFTKFAMGVTWVFLFLFFVVFILTLIFVFNYDLAQSFITF